MREYTLSLIEGDAGREAVGDELGDSPVSYAAFDADTISWLDEHGYDVEHPDRWLLVTPAGDDPRAVNVIAQREIVICA
ncbi:hypothetical protein ACIBK9_11725 [Nonomuraea sp. NPDC050227]|uniref:hypothetical protein n=1 Tax=Nonomuraea sp. NPDC050227 TaxID=3364360 RepID=UPI003789C64E